MYRIVIEIEDVEIRRRLKAKAELEGKTMKDKIIELIKEYLK